MRVIVESREEELAIAQRVQERRSMLASHGCFYCVGAHMDRLLEMYEASDLQKREFVEHVAECYADHGKGMPPIEFTRELYHLLAKTFPDQHPFWERKRRMNDRALELNSLLKARVRICSNSLLSSLRIALAGTAIDCLNDDDDKLLGKVEALLQQPLAADHTKMLRDRLRQGTRILYLADKAGEIVFDRLFIRTISGCQVTYVVNCPNAGLSASGQDADYVDMRLCAKVLANGCMAPYTLIHHGSARFTAAWNAADIIIAKGQGNLESVFPLQDPRVFAFFTCSCRLVSKHFGIPMGSSVVVNVERRLQEVAQQESPITTLMDS